MGKKDSGFWILDSGFWMLDVLGMTELVEVMPVLLWFPVAELAEADAGCREILLKTPAGRRGVVNRKS